MTSKTSLFNRALFLKTVWRLWPLWAGYLGVWILALPVPMASGLRLAEMPLREVTRDVLSAAVYGGPLIALFAGVLAAMGAFSFLYRPKSASAYGALPIRREGIFLSQTLAGLLPLLAVNLLTALITLAVEARSGCVSVDCLLQWLGYSSLYTLCFYGFGVLCAQLTGALLVLPCVYMILEFTAMVVEWLSRKALGLFVYGLHSASDSLGFLSPAYHAVFNSGVENIIENGESVGYFIRGWGWAAAYGAAGLLCLALALPLFRRRRLETAGDVVAVRPLRPVFKYCLAFGCSLCLCMLVYFITDSFSYPFAEVLGLMLLGGFVGYFGALMLMKKSFRAFRGQWSGFIIYSLLLAALLTAVKLDAFGYERRVPAAEDVAGIYVSGWGERSDFSEPENIASLRELHQYLIDAKSQNSAGMGRGFHEYGPYVGLRYTLKNGRTVSRIYYAYDPEVGDEAAARLAEILNTPEGVAGRGYPGEAIAVSEVVSAYVDYTATGEMDSVYIEKYGDKEVFTDTLALSREEAAELYNHCLLPDLRAGALGKIWLRDDEYYEENFYTCSVHIVLTDPKGGENYRVCDFTLTPESVNSNAWMQQRGVTLKTRAQWQEGENR